jgi:hypothetical protein
LKFNENQNFNDIFADTADLKMADGLKMALHMIKNTKLG